MVVMVMVVMMVGGLQESLSFGFIGRKSGEGEIFQDGASAQGFETEMHADGAFES